MGLKMDVKSINQSQMDYVLCGWCPIAYSRRYRGLKDPSMCMWMSVGVHTHALVCVRSQWVMMTTGSPYWSGGLKEGCETDSHTPTRIAHASLHSNAAGPRMFKRNLVWRVSFKLPYYSLHIKIIKISEKNRCRQVIKKQDALKTEIREKGDQAGCKECQG